MADLRISDAPELDKTEINDDLKLPTGGYGNYSVSVSSIRDWLTTYNDFAKKSDITTAIANKVNKNDVYLKTETYSKSEVDTALGLKANIDSVYTKSLTYSKNETDTLLNSKANSSSVYSRSEVDSFLNLKANANNVVTSVNGSKGAVIVTRDTLGIPSDDTIKKFTKEAKYVIDESGLNQQDINDKSLLIFNAIVTPEMFGANGLGDDTNAVKSWLLSSFKYKQARGNYNVNFGDGGVVIDVSSPLKIDATGAKFTPTSKSRYMFRFNVTTSGNSLNIVGIESDVNKLVARPLEVYSLNDSRLSVLNISQCVIKNVKEDSQNMSAVGIRSEVLADIILVQSNTVNSVERTSINAGIVACVGISVARIDKSYYISKNNVLNISTPTTADADGIVTFSEKRLISPSIPQSVAGGVYSNRIENCAGRMVKMQCMGDVIDNYFESNSGTLIPEFRCVDAQFGGVTCSGNTWRLTSDVTLGTSSTFFTYQAVGETGAEDNVGSCENNKLYLAKKISYLCHVSVTGGKHSVKIKGNSVKDEDDLLKVTDMVRVAIPSIATLGSLSVSVEENELTLGDSSLVIVTGAGFKDSTLNNKLTLTIADNKPKGVIAGAKIIENTADASSPYLGDILIKDNGSPLLSFNQLIANGVDVNKLRSGNRFFYATDGSTGGMLNTPAGYNRYVFVDIKSTQAELLTRSGNKKAIRGDGTWYEYSGTIIT